MSRAPRTPDDERAFRAWIDRARNYPIERVAVAFGWRPRRDDQGGPCLRPGCINGPAAKSDRFSINRRKNLFFCRAGGAGGSPIDLVRHVTDLPFMDAVERVTGEKPPTLERTETPAERQAREARLEREELDAQARRADQEKQAADFRERERAAAFRIWRDGLPITGTLAEAYLRRRGVSAPPEAALRFMADAPFYDASENRVVFRGPCMLAAMVRPDGRFSCLHRTWIDLDDPKGKKRVVDPKTGELTSAKKMRGSKKGASILLARDASRPIRRVFLSEGIENCLSVWIDLVERQSPLLEGAEFRAAGDLGNLSGRAAEMVAHPTETLVDAKGRVRKKRVPGPRPVEPDPDATIGLPENCAELWLVGDGSSEPFFTRCALERAAARFARDRDGLTIKLVMADAGVDFNDMRLRAIEAAA